MEKKKSNNKIRNIIIVILSISAITAISYLLITYINSQRNKEIYRPIQQEIIPDTTTEELSKINNEFIQKVNEMQKENNDVKGWIRIENTNINYPLLQTNDNSYYLTHNYKKEKSSYGSIFINKNSNIQDENSNIIIYGHNMKDGQMFRDLLKYQKKEYYNEHPNIKMIIQGREEEYEIIYAFKSRIFYKHEKEVFRFYNYYNFENEDKYNEYINECKKIQLYDTGKTATYGEKLITLITCEYTKENGRMVIVAKKSNNS